jgi:hypothetical protein
MFGYMPYFGFQVGLFYGQEGYNLTEESQYEYDRYFYGAQKVVYDVIEVPVLSHMHIDFWKIKIMAEIGLYGGYRLNIHRIPFNGKYSDEKYAAYQDKFHETENRWDYGIIFLKETDMFSIRLIRSKRKTISIEVAEEGIVTVRAPQFAKEE